jgi:hypothetical protein
MPERANKTVFTVILSGIQTTSESKCYIHTVMRNREQNFHFFLGFIVIAFSFLRNASFANLSRFWANNNFLIDFSP